MSDLQIKLRPATIEDKPFLYNLSKTLYKKLIEHHYGEWDETAQRRKFEMKWKKASYQIIEKNNKRIGTMWVTIAEDHIRLNEIQIHPEFQGKGIGSALVGEQLSIARKLGIPMRLRLLRGNRALQFYKRLGFVVYEESEHYMYMSTS